MKIIKFITNNAVKNQHSNYIFYTTFIDQIINKAKDGISYPLKA